MSAWLSFIGGYAKGANEEIDKQREKEDQYIQDRMKMAAATRLQKQKEAETQRKELEEADKTLAALPGYASAKPEQKIALLASPVIRKQYIDKTSAGEVVNLDDLMTVNAESLKAFPTVESYIKSFQAKPKTADEQTMAAFKQPRQSFGARVGAGEEELKQNAARFGMKPEEALGWEQGGEELPQGNYATLKQSALAPNDVDGELKLIESRGLQLLNDMKDPTKAEASKAEFSKLQTKIIGLNTFKKMMEGGEEAINLQRKLDGIVWEIATTDDPARKKELSALKVQLESAKDLGTRKPEGAGGEKVSFATMFRGGDSAGTRNVMAKFGNLAAKGSLVIVPPTTPEGKSTFKFDKTDIEAQRQVQQAYEEGAMSVFAPMMRDGRPANDNMRIAMAALGVGQDIPTSQRPTAAPAQQKPAAQQQVAPPSNMLKENVNTTFDNGQTWTLRNGVATRVK